MTSREKFEAWWEENYHNGNPPRFGWEAWRDGDGYQIDDDESELDGMWNAWQAAESASQQKLTDMAVQLTNAESKCRELAGLVAENADLKSLIEQHAGSIAVCPNCSREEPSETDDIVALYRSLKTPATDAILAEVRAQGVEIFSEKFGGGTLLSDMVKETAKEFAAQLRKGAAL